MQMEFTKGKKQLYSVKLYTVLNRYQNQKDESTLRVIYK